MAAAVAAAAVAAAAVAAAAVVSAASAEHSSLALSPPEVDYCTMTLDPLASSDAIALATMDSELCSREICD